MNKPKTKLLYDVLFSDQAELLKDQIEHKINKEGWKLQGGVSISSDRCFRVAQAIVKEVSIEDVEGV